jgi:hypothetical protein
MQRRTRSRRLCNRPIFIISILLYFSCAAHFALEFSHFYNALVRTLCRVEVSKSRLRPCRPQRVSMGSRTRQVSSLAPTSLSQSQISSVNLSSYTAAGFSGPGITGSSCCQLSHRWVGLVSILIRLNRGPILINPRHSMQRSSHTLTADNRPVFPNCSILLSTVGPRGIHSPALHKCVRDGPHCLAHLVALSTQAT